MSSLELRDVKIVKLWDWGYDRASDYDYIFLDKNGKEMTRVKGGWFKKKILGTIRHEAVEKIETDETDTTITFKGTAVCRISDEKPEEEEGIVRVQCSES